MGIVNTNMRRMIKGLMATKYIDSCGVKMPQMPNIPDFAPPSAPDLSYIYDELDKINAAAADTTNNESIYTTEYLEAYKKYQELVIEAKQRYDTEVERINNQHDARVNAEEGIETAEEFFQHNTELDNAWNTYQDEVKTARETSNIDTVTKFKRIDAKNKKKANKAAEEETEKKKNAEKAEALKVFTEVALKQYTDWTKQESKKFYRFVDESVAMYKDTANLFKTVAVEAKAYFQDGGPGDKFVEGECDKIDRIYDNFVESFKELGVDLSTLVAKIPNPDVIVAGAATGIPNPAQKVMVFMENMKKVLTDIKKIINYIKEILAIATAIGFAITELIPAFKKLCTDFESSRKDVDKTFKTAVRQIRKRQKWYLEHIHPGVAGETKLAGYMYTDAEVDWVNKEIKVKGYKCYCRKNYAKTYMENGQLKKSYWVGGYTKENGPYTDSSGKKYYYLTTEEISGQSDYDENELLNEMLLDNELANDYDIDLGTLYDDTSGTTKLSLSDGRTITIDYLAASGDVIRLDDGSIIRVK